MVERLPVKEDVAGSNPAPGAKLYIAPALLPCASNNKELHFCLPNFNIFDTIVLNKLIYTQYK